MYNWDDPIEEALNKPEVAKTAPVIQETKEISKVESQPKFEGKQMVMIIQPI